MNRAKSTAFAFDADRQRVIQTEQMSVGETKTIYVTPAYEKVIHPDGLTEHKYYILPPFGRSAVRSDATVGLRHLKLPARCPPAAGYVRKTSIFGLTRVSFSRPYSKYHDIPP